MFRLNNDQASAAVWFATGAIIAIASIPYGLGSLSSPGTGFMPFLTGSAISLFSFIGVMQGTFKKRQGIGWKPTMRGLMWKKSLIVSASLYAYSLLLNYLGFLLCTGLFIGFLLRIGKPQGWLTVIAGSIFTALAAYGVFEVLLKAQLPKGPWGF